MRICALAVFFLGAVLFSPASDASVVDGETYKKIEKINRLVDKGQYGKSLSLIESVQREELNAYEKNLLLGIKAHIYFQTGNTEESLKIYKQMLDSPGLSANFRKGVKSAMAAIYFAEEKYREAIDFIDSEIKPPSLSDIALKGFSFYKLGEFGRVAELLGKAVKSSKKPPENWLAVLQSSYRETGRKEERMKTAEKLAALYPFRRNMLLLSNIYAEAGEPAKQAAVLMLAYEAGQLKKGKHLLLLSRLMYNRGIYTEAAKILEKGIKDGNIEKTAANFELLSRSYTGAKQMRKALSPLREAIKVAENNKPCVELADIYVVLEEWKTAAQTADRCLALPDAGENHRLYIIKGRSFFNLGDIAASSEQFMKAREFKRSETAAIRWLIYIEAEEKRRKRFSDAGMDIRKP